LRSTRDAHCCDGARSAIEVRQESAQGIHRAVAGTIEPVKREEQCEADVVVLLCAHARLEARGDRRCERPKARQEECRLEAHRRIAGLDERENRFDELCGGFITRSPNAPRLACLPLRGEWTTIEEGAFAVVEGQTVSKRTISCDQVCNEPQHGRAQLDRRIEHQLEEKRNRVG
jgi:hypothetical protein